jgi:universal stress protein A
MRRLVDKYQHILVAVDLSSEGKLVASRAAELAKHYNAKLSLLHVVEYIPVDLANELVLPQQQEVEEQLMHRAKEHLDSLAAALKLPAVERHVANGSTKSEILRYAEEQHADLIVIGRHGRHGILRILGSTANAVLHNAPCDVLVVRLGAAG